MSKELADKLEQLADDLHSQAMIDADEVLIMRESIAALRSEQWIPVEERLPEDRVRVNAFDEISVIECFYGSGSNSSVELWQERAWRKTVGESIVLFPVTHWMPLPAAPSRETAKPTYSQEELSAADKRADARHDKLKIDAAEPALSAKQIEVMRVLLIKVGLNPALCDMALSSLTARDKFAKEKAALSQQWLDWGVKRRDEGIEAAAKWVESVYQCGQNETDLVAGIRALKGQP